MAIRVLSSESKLVLRCLAQCLKYCNFSFLDCVAASEIQAPVDVALFVGAVSPETTRRLLGESIRCWRIPTPAALLDSTGRIELRQDWKDETKIAVSGILHDIKNRRKITQEEIATAMAAVIRPSIKLGYLVNCGVIRTVILELELYAQADVLADEGSGALELFEYLWQIMILQ